MKPPLNLLATTTTAWLALSLSSLAVEVDTSFQASIPGGTVHALTLMPDGAILAGGEFDQVNGEPLHSFVKFTTAGVIDPNFVRLPIEGPVFAIASDGDHVFLAGSITLGNEMPVQSVVCLRADGPADPGFLGPLANGRVKRVVAVSSSIFIGGSFWSQPDSFVARLKNDGSKDAGFRCALQPGASMESGVDAIAVQTDGRIVIGGVFETPDGSRALARLNPDGSIDGTFSGAPGEFLYVKAIRILDGSNILVGGIVDSSGRGALRRLNSDGSVDRTFANISLDGSVETINVDASGRIVVGGAFKEVNGVEHLRLARLSADGTLDPSWTVGTDNIVTAIVHDASGHIVVGGAFSEIGGVRQSGIARLKESAPPFLFRALSVNSEGEVHLKLKCAAGKTYVIESSSDLRVWTDFRTSVADEDGLDIAEGLVEGPRKFFRARAAE